MTTTKDHTETRLRIAELLEGGLETEVEPFPETEKEFAQLLTQLKALASSEVVSSRDEACLDRHNYLPRRRTCRGRCN